MGTFVTEGDGTVIANPFSEGSITLILKAHNNDHVRLYAGMADINWDIVKAGAQILELTNGIQDAKMVDGTAILNEEAVDL